MYSWSENKYCAGQGFGSGSGSGSVFGIRIRIRIQEGKNDPQKEKKFMFWSVGWPLLWAAGFFCNLDILYGGLGIGKLQFLIKKKKKKIFSCNFFFNFCSLKLWIRIGSGSVSGSVLVSSLNIWIRIRKKWIRIRNTGVGCLNRKKLNCTIIVFLLFSKTSWCWTQDMFICQHDTVLTTNGLLPSSSTSLLSYPQSTYI